MNDMYSRYQLPQTFASTEDRPAMQGDKRENMLNISISGWHRCCMSGSGRRRGERLSNSPRRYLLTEKIQEWGEERMRKFITTISTLAVGLLTASATATAANWDIDMVHSSVGFKVSHLVVSRTTGTFTDYDANIKFDKDNLEAGSVQAASIDTENEKRDSHLRSGDFLDVVTFPTITFVSTSISPVEDGAFTMTGDFTMRGVTKEVTFECEFHGAVEAFGSLRTGFTAETTINRQDFGVSWDKTLDTGGLVAGNDVDITIELELIQSKEPEISETP